MGSASLVGPLHIWEQLEDFHFIFYFLLFSTWVMEPSWFIFFYFFNARLGVPTGIDERLPPRDYEIDFRSSYLFKYAYATELSMH